jgi:hypothetical protein
MPACAGMTRKQTAATVLVVAPAKAGVQHLAYPWRKTLDACLRRHDAETNRDRNPRRHSSEGWSPASFGSTGNTAPASHPARANTTLLITVNLRTAASD